MGYTYTTISAMVTALRGYLGDNLTVKFWSDDELVRIVIESLRTWNVLARYTRTRDTFPTADATPFYDLSVVLPAYFGYTVTSGDIMLMVENALMEPEAYTVWTGTDMFTIDDIVKSIERRRNQFLLETGCVQSVLTYLGAPDTSGKIELAETVMDVRAAHWITVDGVATPMFRSDEIAARTFKSAWAQTPGVPTSFSTILDNFPHVQLMPPALDEGTLEIVATSAGAPINAAVPGTILGIPDDFAWVIKYGVLCDLLSTDPQSRDDTRSTYCEKRWKEGVELARTSISVLNLDINGRALGVQSLDAMMKFLRGWRNTPARPRAFAMAGQNLLAVGPQADGVYGIGADLLSKFQIPTFITDPLDLAREVQMAVISYAQHVAMFKCGGAEFTATMDEYRQMLEVAAVQNDRLSAMAFYREAMERSAQLQNEDSPRLEVASGRA